MKSVLIVLCLVINSPLYSQLTKQEITGVWICKDVLVSDEEKLSPEFKTAAETAKKRFVNAKFTFGTNGIFNLELPKDKPEVMNTFDFVDNKKWFVSGNRISIGTPRENLMHMDVTKGDGFFSFALYETPLILRMEKM